MGNAPGALDTGKNSVHTVELICQRKVSESCCGCHLVVVVLAVAGARAAPTKRNVSSIKINYKGRTVHTVQGGLRSSSKVKRGDRAISQRLAPSSGQLTPKEQYQHFPFPPHLCLVLLIRHSAAPLPPQSLNKLQQTRRQLCRMINCHLITPLPPSPCH